MRIGLVAPPWVPVPPVRYGGTEEVIDILARGLLAEGHEVRLFTTGDSTCPVDRSWTFDTPAGPMGLAVLELAHVRAAYGALHDCDVIHDHTATGPVWAAAVGHPAPVVVTVWNAQLRLTGADDPRLPTFLKFYGDGHTSPEGAFASCKGGKTMPSNPPQS